MEIEELNKEEKEKKIGDDEDEKEGVIKEMVEETVEEVVKMENAGDDEDIQERKMDVETEEPIKEEDAMDVDEE